MSVSTNTALSQREGGMHKRLPSDSAQADFVEIDSHLRLNAGFQFCDRSHWFHMDCASRPSKIVDGKRVDVVVKVIPFGWRKPITYGFNHTIHKTMFTVTCLQCYRKLTIAPVQFIVFGIIISKNSTCITMVIPVLSENCSRDSLLWKIATVDQRYPVKVSIFAIDIRFYVDPFVNPTLRWNKLNVLMICLFTDL